MVTPRITTFLSCDWGNSTFRLRLVQCGTTLGVIDELRSDRGVRSFDAGPDGFEVYLLEAMEAMDAPSVPVLISGMASSSVGWKELPYAHVPFNVTDTTGLHHESLTIRYRGAQLPVHLFSGVRTISDIMRGEESELVGILTLPEIRAAATEQCLVLMPGTHCKHVCIENGRMIDFTTFMTGEMFELLACQSILRATVDWESLGETSKAHDASFVEGVCAARDHGLAATLFKTRTRGVLDGVGSSLNLRYLLGLLIGDEMKELGHSSEPIVLAAQYPHCYKIALQTLGLSSSQLICLTPGQLAHATVRTHAEWLFNQDAASSSPM